jgi:hypothetical protein
VWVGMQYCSWKEAMDEGSGGGGNEVFWEWRWTRRLTGAIHAGTKQFVLCPHVQLRPILLQLMFAEEGSQE